MKIDQYSSLPYKNRYPQKSPQHSLSFQNQGLSQELPPTQLTLLYVNDTHRKIWPLAKVKKAFDIISSQVGGDVVKTLAGDFTISTNKALFDLDVATINKTGFDIATLGNHEFDAGIPALTAEVEKSSFSYVDSNLDVSRSTPLKHLYETGRIKPATILNINNHRYGFIGVSPPNLMENMSNKNDLSSLRVLDVAQTIQSIGKQVDNLRKNGVNKVILVSHAGYKVDQEIAQKVDGLDIIVGGHSHTELKGIQQGKTLFYSPSGKPVLVLQAGHDGEYLGVAQVMFNDQGEVVKACAQLEEISKYPEDAKLHDFIQSQLSQGSAFATSQYFISNTNAERAEHPVGDLVADAIKYSTQAQVAMVLGGNIRDGIRPGRITDMDIQQLLPFNDALLKIEVPGRYMQDVLQAAATNIKKGRYSPGVIQVSGMKYRLDSDKNICDIYINEGFQKNFKPLDPNKTYTLAVNEYFIDFMKRKFAVEKPERILGKYNYNESDALKYYLSKNPDVKIKKNTDNRIIID